VNSGKRIRNLPVSPHAAPAYMKFNPNAHSINFEGRENPNKL